MEPLKLKHLQLYMTKFELEYGSYEHNTQRHQLSNTFQFKIEGVSETPETADVDIKASYYSTMIKPIVNRKFGNNFHHQYGPHHR